MAISNLASGLRTGVCTSTTRPTAPYNGQVIYETDSKQTLVWQGSAWVMLTDADTPPGLELVKTQTIGSAVSSVTVSDVFSSTYDNYRLVISGQTSSATGNIMFQLSGATGNTYYTNLSWFGWGSATINGYGPAVTNKALICQLYIDTPWSVVMDLMNPNLARRTFGHYQETCGNNDGVGQIMESGTSQHTGFTINPDTGTITGGTIRVYGYRNAV